MKPIHKLFVVIAVVALGFACVGYFAVYRSREALQKSIGESSVALAQETLDKIDRNIYSRIEEMQAYTRTLALAEQIVSSNEEFEEIENVQDYINQIDKEWTSAAKVTITPFMQELIRNELSAELREKVDFYVQKYNYRVFGEVFITNKYGANVAQTGKTTDYYQADEEWWQNAKKYGLYVADIQYDSSADIYSTDIAIRIDDERGNFLGVIKGVLNIKEVIKILKELEEAKKRKAYEQEPYATLHFKLLTKQGRVIYSTKKFEFLQDVSDMLLSHFIAEEEHPAYFIAKGDKPGEEEELFAHAHSEGYGDFKGLEWVLVVEYETGEIFAPVAELRNDIATASFAAAMLVIVIMFIVCKDYFRESHKTQ